MAKSGKDKTTSPKAAKAASSVLRDDRTAKKSKTAAGSAPFSKRKRNIQRNQIKGRKKEVTL